MFNGILMAGLLKYYDIVLNLFLPLQFIFTKQYLIPLNWTLSQGKIIKQWIGTPFLGND